MQGKWIISLPSLCNPALKNAPGGGGGDAVWQRFNGLSGYSSRQTLFHFPLWRRAGRKFACRILTLVTTVFFQVTAYLCGQRLLRQRASIIIGAHVSKWHATSRGGGRAKSIEDKVESFAEKPIYTSAVRQHSRRHF